MSIRVHRAWLLPLALLSSAAQADVYRCRGPNGETVISDKACGVVEQRKKLPERKAEPDGYYRNYQDERQPSDVGAENVQNFLELREREKAALEEKRRADDRLAQEQRYDRQRNEERRAYEKCAESVRDGSSRGC